jgi:hypothetical protein
MKRIYILAGPNGAGKTTASQSLLPELLDCQEFVNADEIAKALSPYKPESVALEAGRIMLSRLNHLMAAGETFAFETTLATKSYKNLLLRAKAEGYRVRLIFFSLRNSDLAISRVKSRVLEGGHNIESDVIKRRFVRGLSNFFYIYSKIIEDWNLFDNSQNPITHIADSEKDKITIYNVEFWNYLKSGNYE